MDVGTVAQFSWADWLVFGLALLATILIGFYYGCTGKKQSTTEEILLGGRKMSLFPVSVSFGATLFSTIAIIGFPSEVYHHGTMIWLIVTGLPIALLVTALIYVPIYHDLKLTSVFEYLELRFNKAIRILAVVIYSFQTLVFISVNLYASSVTLAQVSQVPFWGTVLLDGVICMLYTSVGGIKAVLWADTLQFGLMFCGCLAIIVQGSINLGGLDEVFRIAADHGRMEFDELNPDPRTRHTVWGMIFGMGLLYTAMFSSNQHYVQRCLTLDTKRKAQGSLYINIVISLMITSVCCLLGVVMFASYASCDPMKLGHVDIPDKMIGHFVMDLFGSLKGIPGLFIVTVTAAAMSTMSSGQNALAAVYLEDVTKPIYTAVHKKPMAETFAANITKCFGVFFGLATIAVAFVLAEAKDTLLIIAWKLLGILGGPLFGMFTIGILCPCANAWGAAAGLVSSLGILIWINAGVLMFKIRPDNLPTDISGCIVNISEYHNITTVSAYFNKTSLEYFKTTPISHPFEFNTSFLNVTVGALTHDVELDKESGIFYLYNVSYVWYTLIALIVTFAVGLPVSIVAACITGKYKTEDVDERLLWSVFKPRSGCCSRKKSPTENGSMSTTVITKNCTFDDDDNRRETQNTHGIDNKGFVDFNKL